MHYCSTDMWELCDHTSVVRLLTFLTLISQILTFDAIGKTGEKKNKQQLWGQLDHVPHSYSVQVFVNTAFFSLGWYQTGGCYYILAIKVFVVPHADYTWVDNWWKENMWMLRWHLLDSLYVNSAHLTAEVDHTWYQKNKKTIQMLLDPGLTSSIAYFLIYHSQCPVDLKQSSHFPVFTNPILFVFSH